MAMQVHHTDMAAVGVGGMLAVSKLIEGLASAQGWLASLSYIATLIVAGVTIYYKVRSKGK